MISGVSLAKVLGDYVARGIDGKGPFAGLRALVAGTTAEDAPAIQLASAKTDVVDKAAATLQERAENILRHAVVGWHAKGEAKEVIARMEKLRRGPIAGVRSVLTIVEASTAFYKLAAGEGKVSTALSLAKSMFDYADIFATVKGAAKLSTALGVGSGLLGTASVVFQISENISKEASMTKMWGDGLQAGGYLMMAAPPTMLAGAVTVLVGAYMSWLGDDPGQNPIEARMSRLGLLPQN